MITCDLPFHSQEIEYLDDGKNGVIFSKDTNAAEYGKEIATILADTTLLRDLQKAANKSTTDYKIK